MAGLFRSVAKAVVMAGVLLSGTAAVAQESGPLPPRKASLVTVRQIHSGHSLSDTYGSNPWPGRLIAATSTLPGNNAHETIQRSIIPGAPLSWRWENPSYPPDARKDIVQFKLLVTTEGVPLNPDPAGFKADTLDWLDKWVAHAWKEGNGGRGAEVMLYSTWTYWQHSGTPPEYDPEPDVPFRERLERDGARWERMQDTANANRPKDMPPIYMIPGHRLLMRVYDDIAEGKVPGMTSIGDIFADDIHLNDIGAYAITCLVYAVIYQRNPRELPYKLIVPDDTLSAAQSEYFRAIAWEVATSYPRSGVPAQ